MEKYSLKKKASRYKPVFQPVFVCAKNELAPFATVFVHYPENIQQQGLGTLFGILKIDDRSEESSYIVNLLTSVLKKEYFSKPHRVAEESFETALRKANLALAELVRHGSKNWAGKICFAGGSLERNNLHFSCLGDISIFLVRHGQIADIGKDLEAEKEEESHPLKTFSNISSGRLEIGDKLIFATKELTDIFSAEEIRQNAEHFSFQEFPGFLEISLQANSELAGTIVVDMRDTREDEKVVLAPLFGKETVKKIDSFVGEPERPIEIIEPLGPENVEIVSRPHESHLPGKKIKFFEKIAKVSRKISESAKNGWLKTKTKTGQFAKKISSSPEKPAVKKPKRKFFASGLKKITAGALPQAKKISKRVASRLSGFGFRDNSLYAGLGIALALIIIVFLIFFAMKSKNRRLATEDSPTSQTEEQIPGSLPSDINAKNAADFATIAELEQNAQTFALMNKKIYAPGKNSIFQIDPESKNMDEIKPNISYGNFQLLAAMPDLASLFILTEDKKIISLTPINKNFNENSIEFPGNLAATDMKTYLTYLYILDSSSNQIYRYPRAAGGFGDMQNWLKSGADLQGAKSFSINDDIFVASDINIMPFIQGKLDSSVNFQKPQIPLRIDKIYTEPGLNFVYALDNANHRVVQFDKSGKIASQYFSDSIDSVKDFAADEQSKVIYLLKGNEIDKFSLE